MPAQLGHLHSGITLRNLLSEVNQTLVIKRVLRAGPLGNAARPISLIRRALWSVSSIGSSCLNPKGF